MADYRKMDVNVTVLSENEARARLQETKQIQETLRAKIDSIGGKTYEGVVMVGGGLASDPSTRDVDGG